MLKYLDIQPACDMMFGTFMVVWLITRHVFYPLILWSLYTEAPEIIKYGCYWGPTDDLQGPIDPPDRFNHLVQPFLDPVGLVCWNANIAWSFMVTLLALQVILLLWFGMIVRVAIKVVKGAEAEDSRSDDEASSEEMEAEEDVYCPSKGDGNDHMRVNSYEEEVGADAVKLASRRLSPPRRFRKGNASGGLPIPSDSKELLGRIGCDKGA